MFKCENCKRQTIKGEKQFKLVTKTRSKKYKHERIEQREKKIIESSGWEIAEERSVCHGCFTQDNN
jgi:nitrate reductase alpha subunit